MTSVLKAIFDSSSTDPMDNADSDMKAVLDAVASLHPKPIETLSAQEARKQPTPSDGVKLVMKQKGKNPADPMGIETKDSMYTSAAGELPARILNLG